MIINLKPTYKQYKALQELAITNNKSKFILFGGAAGGGKSWLGVEWVLTLALAYPKTRYFIGRNELKRLMSSTYITFIKVCSYHKIPKSMWKLNGQYNYIEFTNGSRIDLLDVAYQPKDPLYERFGSTEYTSGFLEEASEMDFGAFDVLKSRVGRHLNKEYGIPPKIYLSCNPKKCWLYDVFYRPWKNGTLPDGYVFVQALISDNPYIDSGYITSLEMLTDNSKKERLLFGNWEYSDDATLLFNYESILSMFTNTYVQMNSTGKRYISVDVARLGTDKTCIMVWDGWSVIHITTHVKKRINETNHVVKKLAKQYGVPNHQIIYDSDGVGGGAVDYMTGSIGFVNNAKPISNSTKVNYSNLKSQCYFEIAKKVNNNEIFVSTNDQDIKNGLIQDLENIKDWNSDKDEKVRVIPKDKLKELIGRSSDYGDAFMIRMYFELLPAPRSLKIKGLC